MTRKQIISAIAVCVLVSALGRPASTLASAEDAQESVGTQLAYAAGSTILTAVHVPAKVALCGASAVLSGITYLVTFGSRHVAKDASDTVKGVCTGPYIISPQRLRTQGE